MQPLANDTCSRTLVAIAPDVPDYQTLIEGAMEGVEILLLNPERDGVAQITEAVYTYSELTALHIISHGAPGCLYLGNTELSLYTLERYELDLLLWFIPTLFNKTTPSLMLYGCNVAADDAGAQFLQRLHELTGASIAASTRTIGNAAKGGTWELDTLIPSLPLSLSPSPFSRQTLATYSGILASGDLDPTFGGNGTGSVLTGGNWGASTAQDVIVQPDGKILVIGWAGTPIRNTPNFTVVRHNPDGTLDTTYGTGGVISYDLSANGELNADYAYSGFLQSDGSLLVAGSAQIPFRNLNMAVAKFRPDGSLDTSFGSNGRATLDFGNNLGEARSILTDSSNRIWVVGYTAAIGGGSSSFGNFAIARYTQSGQLDTTFGNGTGIVQTDINGGRDEAYSATFLSDGRLLVAGRALNSANNTYDLTLAVYDQSGNLDTSFGGGTGRVFTDFTPPNQATAWDDVGYKVEVYNNKIWVVGNSFSSVTSSPQLAIARYNLDGTLDTSFGNNGKVLDLPNFSASARDIVFQPDGKFLVAVEVPNGNPTLVRFNANGTLDTTFSGDGIAIAPDTAGNNLNSSYSVALQTVNGETKAVLVGSAAGGFSVTRFDLGIVANRPPVATDDAVTVTEDSTASLNVLSNDSDPDNNPLAIANINTNGLQGTLTDNGNGSYTYNPGNVFQSLAAGQTATTTFNYTISDGTDTASATATISVTGENDAPIAENDTLTTTAGQALTITAATLLQNDRDVDTGDSLSLQAVSNATNGTVVLDANGNVVFTPTSGFSGTASFEYTVRDTNNTTSTGSVSITVNDLNDAPVNTVPGSQTVNADTAIVFSSANNNRISISDPDAGTNPVEVALTATNGTLTLSGTNGLTFTSGNNSASTFTVRGSLTDLNTALEGLRFNPTAGYTGNASIQIATNDLGNTGSGGALTDTDTINITVNSSQFRFSVPMGVAFQPDGKVILAGRNEFVDATGSWQRDEFALIRYTSNGQLDTSFSGDGKVSEPFWGNREDGPQGFAVQPDGRVVMVGSVLRDLASDSYYDFAVMRFNPNGSLDRNFSGDGKLTTNFSEKYSFDYANRVAVQSDGKIVVAGTVRNSVTNNNQAPALARYNPDGSLDPTFGTGGLVARDVNLNLSIVGSVLVQPDGKIVLAGTTYSEGSQQNVVDFVLLRYNPNGSLDSTFGNSGIARLNFGNSADILSKVILQTDGKLLAVGQTFDLIERTPSGAYNRDVALARFNSDGTVDTSFSFDGKVTTDLGATWDNPSSVMVQPDGKLVVVAQSGLIFDQSSKVIRYNSDGWLDETFGNYGIEDFVPSARALDATVKPDGTLVVAGISSGTGGTPNLVLVDYDTGLGSSAPLSGSGGQKTFTVQRGQTQTITNFGGVGSGSTPSQATIAEADTIQFSGANLIARNMLLTQTGSNLEITFAGVNDTKVVLQNFALENLDNFTRTSGEANVILGNIRFDGQTGIANSFDVIDANAVVTQVLRQNTVTFLNNLDNTVTGFDASADVINGQGGNDTLTGMGGNDLLRGSDGDDVLLGGAGADTLTGGTGADGFVFDSNRPFVTTDLGVDAIIDFSRSEGDKIVLDLTTFIALTSPAGGVLSSSDFAVINATTNGAAGRLAAPIVYNQGTGDLLYNPDGTTAGLTGGGRFATLTGTPSLSATDFLVRA